MFRGLTNYLFANARRGGDVTKDCPGRSADETAKEAVGGGGKCRPLVVDEAREEWGPRDDEAKVENKCYRTLIEVGLLGGREVAGVGVLVGAENDRQATQGEDRN